jgi:hypothetical protein
MANFKKNQSGEILLDTEQDCSLATKLEIWCKKPNADRTVVKQTATLEADDQTVKASFTFDVAGNWERKAVITFSPANEVHGEVSEFTVDEIW